MTARKSLKNLTSKELDYRIRLLSSLEAIRIVSLTKDQLSNELKKEIIEVIYREREKILQQKKRDKTRFAIPPELRKVLDSAIPSSRVRKSIISIQVDSEMPERYSVVVDGELTMNEINAILSVWKANL